MGISIKYVCPIPFILSPEPKGKWSKGLLEPDSGSHARALHWAFAGWGSPEMRKT